MVGLQGKNESTGAVIIIGQYGVHVGAGEVGRCAVIDNNKGETIAWCGGENLVVEIENRIF